MLIPDHSSNFVANQFIWLLVFCILSSLLQRCSVQPDWCSTSTIAAMSWRPWPSSSKQRAATALCRRNATPPPVQCTSRWLAENLRGNIKRVAVMTKPSTWRTCRTNSSSPWNYLFWKSLLPGQSWSLLISRMPPHPPPVAFPTSTTNRPCWPATARWFSRLSCYE